MSYLFDTNAVSEITRPRPDPGFQTWLATVRPMDSYISVLTVGELRRGITNLPDGRKRDLLESLNRELVDGFEERVLPVSAEIAALWGDMSGLAKNRGRAIAVVDGLIAATAIVHDLTVVTRNLWDFDPTGCRMLCPWDQGPSAD